MSAADPLDLLVVGLTALVTRARDGARRAAARVCAPPRGRGLIGVANAAAAGCMVAAVDSSLGGFRGRRVGHGGRRRRQSRVHGARGAGDRPPAGRPLRGARLGGRAQGALIVGVMTVHSVAEGIGVGVSFAVTRSLGLATALAIAVHNIPEGLAIGLRPRPRGVRVLHAAGWSVVSSLPQPPCWRCLPSRSWRRSPASCRSGSGSQPARCSG